MSETWTNLSFRRVTMDDLPLLYRWLTMSHVNEWYGEGNRTYEETVAHYRGSIEGGTPTDAYLILLDERPVGYIQGYVIADHPEYAAAVQVEEGAAGVDLYIGEPDLVHRGLGSTALRKFVEEIVFANPRVSCCVIGPQPENKAAIRAYEKAGFRYFKTVEVPGDPGPEYLMERRRSGL